MRISAVYTERACLQGKPSWGFGLAWRRPNTREVVFVLIPLNFVAAWLREAYYRLRQGPRDRLRRAILEERERDTEDGFSAGYEARRKEGREAGMRTLAALFAKPEEEPW